MDDVVSRILSAAKEKGIDQKTLAQRAGIRQQSITDWKKGLTTSYTKYLPELAEVLGVSVDYLLTGDEKTPAAVSGSEREEEFMELFRRLPPEAQARELAYLRQLADEQDK